MRPRLASATPLAFSDAAGSSRRNEASASDGRSCRILVIELIGLVESTRRTALRDLHDPGIRTGMDEMPWTKLE